MFDERMISGDSLQANQRFVAKMQVRLPWYRALPLSCVERIELMIDGKEISRGDLHLGIYGQTYSLERLHDLPNVLWFQLDTADLYAELDEPVSQGEHEVRVAIEIKIPYSSKPFRQVAHCTKSLMLSMEKWL